MISHSTQETFLILAESFAGEDLLNLVMISSSTAFGDARY